MEAGVKKIYCSMLFMFLISGNLFSQVTLSKFLDDWKSTKESLKSSYANKGVQEQNIQGMNIVSYKDKYQGADAGLGYIFTADGKLMGKTIAVMTKNETEAAKYFNIVKKSLEGKYGAATKKNQGAMETYSWKSGTNITLALFKMGNNITLMQMKK